MFFVRTIRDTLVRRLYLSLKVRRIYLRASSTSVGGIQAVGFATYVYEASVRTYNIFRVNVGSADQAGSFRMNVPMLKS